MLEVVHHIETRPLILEPQEYRLTIARSGIDVVGGDTEGVRNGVQTLRQIIRQCAPALPRLVIADKPAYKSAATISTPRAAASPRSTG